MAYHHLAVATRDITAIDAFYTVAMGFDLVKVSVGKTPEEGWAKHFFYDTGGGQLMAFWEIHDDTIGTDFETGLSRAAGLPDWVNHIAFAAADLNDIAKRKQRLLDHGHDVVEIDHGWCVSIYAVDPNGTLVEFCTTTAAFSEADRELARKALRQDDLEFEEPVSVQVHKAGATP
ncbi:MAG: VOC family protein [Proteobacteria bacterium]|nr:VOC family protein [Pseudomonadota bacterium]